VETELWSTPNKICPECFETLLASTRNIDVGRGVIYMRHGWNAKCKNSEKEFRVPIDIVKAEVVNE